MPFKDPEKKKEYDRLKIAEKRTRGKAEREAKREQEQREQLAKYASASSIKVLLSFKKYTELNPAKKKL